LVKPATGAVIRPALDADPGVPVHVGVYRTVRGAIAQGQLSEGTLQPS
jgi:hypothetical protein